MNGQQTIEKYLALFDPRSFLQFRNKNRRKLTLGHNAPKGRRYTQECYERIFFPYGLAYHKGLNAVFDEYENEVLLYTGKACIYTDKRFYFPQNRIPFFYLEGRFIDASDRYIGLKKAKRILKRIKNLPKGTVIWLQSPSNDGFLYKVTKPTPVWEPEYQVDLPEYAANFEAGTYEYDLTNALRAAGFLVAVDFSLNDGGFATAFGHLLTVGFEGKSQDTHERLGRAIRWDSLGSFNKWSQANCIVRRPVAEVVQILLAEAAKLP